MNGNSFLVLVSVGVIGLGSAMPYWASYQPDPETASTQAPTEFQTGYAESQPPDLVQPKSVKMTAFIGDQETSRQNPALEQQALRPAYSPFKRPARGLDQGAATIPKLSSRYSDDISAATKKQAIDFSPANYQKVALAQRPTRQALPRKVVPISLSQDEEEYYPVAKPVEKPEKVARAIPQRRVSFEPPVVIRRKHKITDGDSLEALAEKFLNDRLAAWAIYEANRELLESPDLLPIGVMIEIPVQSELTTLKKNQVKLHPVMNLIPVAAPQPVPHSKLVPIRH